MRRRNYSLIFKRMNECFIVYFGKKEERQRIMRKSEEKGKERKKKGKEKQRKTEEK